FDMMQLLAEIRTGLANDVGCNSVDRAKRVGPMAAHHVKARRIQFRDDKEAPLQPGSILEWRFRNQRALGRGIHSRQVGHNCGALTDAEVAVLEQWNFLTRIELGVFSG